MRSFCLSFGLNQNEITVPVDSLYSENRKLLDEECNRYFFIENPNKVKISGSDIKQTELPLHPNDEKRGKRKLKVSNEFFLPENVDKGKVYRLMHLFNFKDGKFISAKHSPELNAKLIHWLPAEGNVEVEILMPDGTKKQGIGEKNLENVKVGEVIQFERFAFCRLDEKNGDKYSFWFTHA